MQFYSGSCPMICYFCKKNLSSYNCENCNVYFQEKICNLYYKRFYLIVDSLYNNKLFAETKTNDPYVFSYRLITKYFSINALNLKQIYQKIDNIAILL